MSIVDPSSIRYLIDLSQELDQFNAGNHFSCENPLLQRIATVFRTQILDSSTVEMLEKTAEFVQQTRRETPHLLAKILESVCDEKKISIEAGQLLLSTISTKLDFLLNHIDSTKLKNKGIQGPSFPQRMQAITKKIHTSPKSEKPRGFIANCSWLCSAGFNAIKNIGTTVGGKALSLELNREHEFFNASLLLTK